MTTTQSSSKVSRCQGDKGDAGSTPRHLNTSTPPQATSTPSPLLIRAIARARALARPRTPTPAQIIGAVCAIHGLDPSDLLDRVTTAERRRPHLCLTAPVVACRRDCILALHELRPDMSQPEIARACGFKTHARVNEVLQAHRAEALMHASPSAATAPPPDDVAPPPAPGRSRRRGKRGEVPGVVDAGEGDAPLWADATGPGVEVSRFQGVEPDESRQKSKAFHHGVRGVTRRKASDMSKKRWEPYVVVHHNCMEPVVPVDCNPGKHGDEGMLVYRSKAAALSACRHQFDTYEVKCKAVKLSTLIEHETNVAGRIEGAGAKQAGRDKISNAIGTKA